MRPMAFKRRNKKPDNNNEQEPNIQTAAHLRIQRDLADIEIVSYIKFIREENEWMNFYILFHVQAGFWKGFTYKFSFQIPEKYPFEGPKVKCVDYIYHPNIDVQGNICVNILRPWKPTYSIQSIIFALEFLFNEPNANDPLNNEAAADMRNNLTEFAVKIKQMS